ncbi:hypothetical protein [Novosphingobium sp.]
MMLFGKDFVRSLVLGFAVGSAAMAITFSADTARAAPVAAPIAVIGS